MIGIIGANVVSRLVSLRSSIRLLTSSSSSFSEDCLSTLSFSSSTLSVLKSDLPLYDLSSNDESWLLLVGYLFATVFFAGVTSTSVLDGTAQSPVIL